MKPTKRKAFNFLRSYFDALNQIPEDNDKLDFLLAVINKQFLDEDPNNLNLIAKLSYEGQRHSIDKSIKGYKDKMKTDLLGNPLQGGYKGGGKHPKEHPLQQEKEQEKEKVKEKLIITIPKEEKIFLDKREIYRTYAIQLSTDMLFIEAVSRNHIKHSNNEVNKKTIHKYLKIFLTHLDETKEVHNNKKDFQNHFSNWLRKQTIELASIKTPKLRYS